MYKRQVYLYGDVQFTKHDGLGSIEMDITTQSAVIYPKEEKVETDKFGVIKTPDSKTSGVGIIANIDITPVTGERILASFLKRTGLENCQNLFNNLFSIL